MTIEELGLKPGMLPENEHGVPARVTATHRARYEVVGAFGTGVARLKAKAYDQGGESFPTTGDFVLLNDQAAGDSLILKTLPRRTFFSRADPTPGRGEQVVAANFDIVFLLQSLNHDFNPRRLERYLTLAWQSGAEPVVLLTKADLTEGYERALMAAREVAVGATVFAVSARTGAGLSEIMPYLAPGKTLVLLGSSGVGKSTLVNALAGREVMPTAEIREDDSRGRHTTTHRQLIVMPSGAMIIDTPGMRELGMWDVSEGLNKSFADVGRFLGQCRFADCRHGVEPGCAVRAAIVAGELSEERWQSYLRLKKEARYADDKEAFLRDKSRWHKSVALANKRAKKNGGRYE